MGKVKTLKNNRYLQGTKQLGQGAFASVYPGKDTLNNRLVAVKKIDIIKNKEYIDKIDQECQLHSSLPKNCHVLEFIDNFNEDNNIYIITELCEFGDLDNFLNLFENKTLPEDVAKLFANQILMGFLSLYDLEIIHRDMKLQNILLNKNFECKIADFGLAKSFHDVGQTYVGTPMTMAPEILFNQEYNRQCDVWSFGCIVYAMTHGNYPFFPPTNCFNRRKVLEDMVKNRQLHFTNPYISDNCKSFIDKTLQIDPNNRITFYEMFDHPWLQECSQNNYAQKVINKYLSHLQYKEVHIDNDFASEFGFMLRHLIDTTIKQHCKLLESVFLKFLNKQNQSKEEKKILYLLSLIITKMSNMTILFTYQDQRIELPLTQNQIQMFKDVISEDTYQKSKIICDKMMLDLAPVIQTLITTLIQLAQTELTNLGFNEYQKDFGLIKSLIDLLTSETFGLPFTVTIDEEQSSDKKLQSLQNISIKEAYINTENEEDFQDEELFQKNKIGFKFESKNFYQQEDEKNMLIYLKEMISSK